MENYRATKKNNKSPTSSNKKQFQEKIRPLEAQINYPETSAEEISSVVAIAGVPAPGKTSVTKPNIAFPTEKFDPLKATALYIQGILKR